MADFAAPDLIQLPRFSGAEAVTFIARMLAVAEGQGDSLPPPIGRALRRLRVTHDALASALSGRGAGTDALRRDARRLDAAWEATFDWLAGWCKLAEEANPHRAAARSLFMRIFADGLTMGTLLYKVELAESRELLVAIEREHHEATFAVLGGGAFLAHLRRTHEALDVLTSREAGIDIRPPLTATIGALRQYVIRVSSHADSEIAGSEALAATLLEPLESFLKLHPTRPLEPLVGDPEETVF